MNSLQQYSIPFVGLKQGVHLYHYEIKDEFWKNFPYTPILKSEVAVELAFDKKSDFFALNFKIDGKVNVECDRCSDFFDLPVHGENKIVVKFAEGAKSESDDADMIFISRAETEFNAAQLLYELINLCIPMHKVHPYNEKGESTCNKKMLKELKKHLHQEGGKEIDPRWAALKKISQN